MWIQNLLKKLRKDGISDGYLKYEADIHELKERELKRKRMEKLTNLNKEQLERLKDNQELNNQFEKSHRLAEKSHGRIGSELLEAIAVAKKYEDALLELGLNTEVLKARMLENAYCSIIDGQPKYKISIKEKNNV